MCTLFFKKIINIYAVFETEFEDTFFDKIMVKNSSKYPFITEQVVLFSFKIISFPSFISYISNVSI